MSVLKKPVSAFENCRSTTGTEVTLWEWLIDESERDAVECLRDMLDPETRKRIKESLPMCLPSGRFSGRSELIEHSGLICIDIDYKDNRHIRNFDKLKEIFATAPFVAYVSLSASGKGYFILILIEQPERHADHFRAIEKLFAKLGIVIDPSCKDVTRPRFKSYDPARYVNHHPAPFRPVLSPKDNNRKPSPEDTKRSREWVEAAIAEIERQELDLTSAYEDWRDIGFALGSEFGEDGREYFHRVSQFHPDYTAERCDLQYGVSLSLENEKGIRIGTFFKKCRDAGIPYKALADFRDVVIE